MKNLSQALYQIHKRYPDDPEILSLYKAVERDERRKARNRGYTRKWREKTSHGEISAKSLNGHKIPHGDTKSHGEMPKPLITKEMSHGEISHGDGILLVSKKESKKEREDYTKSYPDTSAAEAPKYAFEDGIIRLNQKDFDAWQKAFKFLDLAAELLSLSDWAGRQGKEKWFHACKGALAKRNREVKAAKEKQIEQPFKWNGAPGIL